MTTVMAPPAAQTSGDTAEPLNTGALECVRTLLDQAERLGNQLECLKVRFVGLHAGGRVEGEVIVERATTPPCTTTIGLKLTLPDGQAADSTLLSNVATHVRAYVDPLAEGQALGVQDDYIRFCI